MGIRENIILSLRAARDAEVTAASYSPDDIPSGGVSFYNGALIPAAGYVDRATALSVPAVKRARDLICSLVASAPFVEITPDNQRIPARPFLANPDKTTPRANIMAKTVADLMFDSMAVWFITSRYAEDDRPATAKHIPISAVDIQTDAYNDIVKVSINGQEVDQRNVIIFEALSGGILNSGARAIWTSVHLEKAVQKFAKTPLPNVKVKNSGPKLDQDQVDDLMGYYEAALANKATLYEGRDVDVNPIGWNPEQLGLNSARQAQAVEIARLTGVPAWYLYADPGSSMTYSNNTQARLDLYSLAITPYTTVIEQRLSMDDVTGRGTRVELDFSEFLRADPELRARIYNQLVPIGVMTAEQAAEMEPLVP